MNSEVALITLLQKIETLAGKVECHCCLEAPKDPHDDDCHVADVLELSTLAHIIESRSVK